MNACGRTRFPITASVDVHRCRPNLKYLKNSDFNPKSTKSGRIPTFSSLKLPTRTKSYHFRLQPAPNQLRPPQNATIPLPTLFFPFSFPNLFASVYLIFHLNLTFLCILEGIKKDEVRITFSTSPARFSSSSPVDGTLLRRLPGFPATIRIRRLCLWPIQLRRRGFSTMTSSGGLIRVKASRPIEEDRMFIGSPNLSGKTRALGQVVFV